MRCNSDFLRAKKATLGKEGGGVCGILTPSCIESQATGSPRCDLQNIHLFS